MDVHGGMTAFVMCHGRWDMRFFWVDLGNRMYVRSSYFNPVAISRILTGTLG